MVKSRSTNLNDIFVRSTLMRFIVLCVLQQHLVHVCASVLEQLVATVEDYQRNLTVTEHAQLISLLHQAKLALCECYLLLTESK